jgi:hypothetical protein
MSFKYNVRQALINAVQAQIPAFGRLLIVKSSSDSADYNYQVLNETFEPEDGRVRFFTSLADAYSEAQTNNNDVICLDAHTAHTVTSMLTVSKSRVHFFGFDGGGHQVQQGARIYMGVTGVATDLAPILVTGTRCSFRNLKVENASTTNQSLYGFIDNGEGTVIENCHFLKTAGLDDSGHAHFWMAGDSLSMKNCTIGQSNVPNTAAGYGILIDGKSDSTTTTVVKECFLKDIRVNMSVGGSVQATSCFIKVADDAAMNFGNAIENFRGYNFIPVGGTIMTNGVLAPASITSGSLFLTSPAFFGCTGVSDNASAGVQIAAPGLAPVAAGGLAANLSD